MNKKIVSVIAFLGALVSPVLCVKNLVTTLQCHDGRVCLAITNDGEWMASGGNDQKLKLWQQQEDTSWKLLQTINAKKEQIYSVAFDPTGTLLAVGYKYGSVILFEKKGPDDWKFKKELKGKIHQSLTEKQIQKLIDMEYIKCFSDLNEKFIDNPNDDLEDILQEKLAIEKNAILALSFDPKGERLAIGYSTGALSFWKKNKHESWDLEKEFEEHAGGVFSVCFSPTGNLLFVGGMSTIPTVSVYKKESNTSWKKEKSLHFGYTGTVSSILFDGVDQKIISASHDGAIKSLVNKNVEELGKMKDGVSCAAMNVKRTLLAYGDFQGNIELYEKNKKDEWVFSRKVGAHIFEKGYNLKNGVSSLVFDKNNDFLILGGYDGSIRVWDIFQNKELFSKSENFLDKEEKLIEEKGN